MSNETKILQELKIIKKELIAIKHNLVGNEVLSAEDKKLLEESYNNEKEGKLLSTAALKKRLKV